MRVFRSCSAWCRAGLIVAQAFAACPLFAQDDYGLHGRIDQLVSSIYRSSEPGAAVLVKSGGRVILRKGYGKANLEWNAAVTTETVFRIGSITKQFTAVGILMLVQEGKIALDDPVSKFLPGINGTATVEHLLTHTSGLESLARSPGYSIWSSLNLKPDEVVGLFDSEPRGFQPGEGWKYSALGYILLGTIIEKVAGVPYRDFLRDKIFIPLGMKNTYYDDGVQIIHGRAAGYSFTRGEIRNAPYCNMAVISSAGSLASTIDDLALWDEALYGSRLVNGELLARAFIPYHLRDGRSTSYGYGWVIDKLYGETVVEHGGRINGFEAHLLRVPSQRIFICVLTNAFDRDPGPDYVATRILEEVLGKRRDDFVELSIAQKGEYVGRYRFATMLDYSVLVIGNRLVLRRASGEERELVAVGVDQFRFRSSYSRVTFSRNGGGKVTGLIVKMKYGQELSAERLDAP